VWRREKGPVLVLSVRIASFAGVRLVGDQRGPLLTIFCEASK